MNYKETTQWMFNQLPMYQNQGVLAYKEDLTNIKLLANHLQNPQNNFQCLHIAGTNGKGSTSHILASSLQEAGYVVGLYTSPHLVDFRERIKINGKSISKKFVCDFINTNKSFFEKNNLSFFEMSVGLAFDYFAKQKIDIAVIEVGLGGRLDSTNIINPLISVITNIGIDHTFFLGNTLAKIATEKAGIIKPKTPVVIGEYLPETRPVFETKANENQSKIYFAQDLVSDNLPSDLLGNYQKNNKKTALQTLKILNKKTKFKITETQIAKGFLNVVKNTGLQGRWQQLGINPKIICDTAHNENGLNAVLNQIQNEKFNQIHFVLGFVNDKDLDKILPLFPKNAIYYWCKPNLSRGLETNILKQKALQFNLKGEVFLSVKKAFEQAKNTAKNTDFIYVGGSTFVVAEVLTEK